MVGWKERWFVLTPSALAYYVSRDEKDKKGEISVTDYLTVEVNCLRYIYYMAICLSNGGFRIYTPICLLLLLLVVFAGLQFRIQWWGNSRKTS